MNGRRRWWYWLILLLVIEKIVQHIVVTGAFYTDWQQIGATVVVDPAELMVTGGIIAVLFMLALWAMLTARSWALDLVIALALVDIVGEFYAQGTFAILITISFAIACLLLFVALVARKNWKLATRQRTHAS